MDYNSSSDLNLVKTILDRLFTAQQVELTREGLATVIDPVVFTQDTSTNAGTNTTVMGGGGYFQVTNNDVPVVDQATVTAAATRFTPNATFLDNLPISRNFMADQQMSAVSQMVRDRARAYEATRNRTGFSIYNNGFTSQTTIDGVALFSNSHVNQNGDTVDNLETGALSDSNLNIAATSLRTQLAQSGYIAGYNPDFLLVPTGLHQTANAITKSVLRAGTGNNDVNYWSDIFPGMKCVYSPFLTSTTAWFMGAKNNGVMRFVREGFSSTLVPWQYQANDEYQYKMRAREGYDSIYYNGLVGSNGTA
jgi:hypothetical protein